MQLESKVMSRIAWEWAEPARKLRGVAQIGGGSKVVEASAQLLRTQTTQRARGELIVMAQLLQLFRRE